MAKMSDSEVLALCQAQMRGALGFLNGRLAQSRLKALQFYNAEPYGNEVEGASQIVTTEVRDTIESAMPSLMKVFMSGDTGAQFDPVGPEDEAVAEQATDYANYIFTRDNDGFGILQTAFRDGLIQKQGVVKIFWEQREDSIRETYSGLTDEELLQLLAPDEVQLVAHSAYEAMFAGTDPASGLPVAAPARLHDAVVRRRRPQGRVRIVNVPPEEFLISRRATSLADAAFVGHRVKKTASELIEQGYDRKLVESLPGRDGEAFNPERLERFRAEDEAPDLAEPALDPAMREIWLTECYLRVDCDGDGIAELRKITVAGDPAATLLDNEEIDSLPFRAWTPIPQPHKFFGLSLADLTMDLQLAQSTVVRQLLDNMYRVNNGRAAISGKVNIEDMLTVRPGGLVRMTDPNTMPEGHIMPLVTPPLGGMAYPLLEFLDSKQELRTGITRYNQGLDANSLNKTASGINTITGYAQQRQELIARNAAEMLVAGIFKSILELICKHQQEPRIIRLRNRWVAMDPRLWNEQMDVTVTVGLGTGNKDQQLGHLMMILQVQQQALQQLGPGNPLVGLDNIYNTLARICENAGLKSPGPYFKDPGAAPQTGLLASPLAGPVVSGAGAPTRPGSEAETLRARQEPEIRLREAAIAALSDLIKARIHAGADIETARIKAGADLQGSLGDRLHELLSGAEQAASANTGVRP
jgi:hypothetical protein